MDLTSPKIIKELLKKYQTGPNKGLGQNFLIDKNVLEKIIATADIQKNETILEVGPGIGTLTQELATRLRQGFGEARENGGQVVAIEKDEKMVEILAETLKEYKNVKIIQGDVLSCHSGLDPESTSSFCLDSRLRGNDSSAYKVVANIPYYLTSPLIRKFLESKNQPSEIVLLLQKEVAQRICAVPPKMSLLAVSVQFYASAKIISYVSKNCFWPAPKVDSAIIKITPHSRHCEAGEAQRSNLFFKIVKAGFIQPRKQLAGNLSKTLKIEKSKVEEWLKKNNISPTQRAETLSVNDWIKLLITQLS